MSQDVSGKGRRPSWRWTFLVAALIHPSGVGSKIPNVGELGAILDLLTTEGELSQAEPGGAVRCVACGHRCLIREGKRGICQVRFNRGGKLQVPWGYVAKRSYREKALLSRPSERQRPHLRHAGL
jgi:hypothetical protein